MKIIGFSQLHNELSKGNLNGWLEDMSSMCDRIYIYDQASTDGSLDYYAKFPDLEVIRSTTNNFENELICKRILLQKLLNENPDCDWIFWMDGDTRLDARLDTSLLRSFLRKGSENGVDGFSLGHLNLWRSNCYYRLDSNYHDFHKWGRIPFWRNNGRLEFPMKRGLHQSQESLGLDTVIRLDYNLIHKGFSADSAIVARYNHYRSLGQSGDMLSRLVDESKLWVERVDDDVLPYEPCNTDPTTLTPIRGSL